MGDRRLSLRSTFTQTLGNEEFCGREAFEGGFLPTEKQVIEMMVWVMAPRKDQKQVSMGEAARILAETLKEHWIWSNVYPKKLDNIKKSVEKLFQEFKQLTGPLPGEDQEWNGYQYRGCQVPSETGD